MIVSLNYIGLKKGGGVLIGEVPLLLIHEQYKKLHFKNSPI